MIAITSRNHRKDFTSFFFSHIPHLLLHYGKPQQSITNNDCIISDQRYGRRRYQKGIIRRPGYPRRRKRSGNRTTHIRISTFPNARLIGGSSSAHTFEKHACEFKATIDGWSGRRLSSVSAGRCMGTAMADRGNQKSRLVSRPIHVSGQLCRLWKHILVGYLSTLVSCCVGTPFFVKERLSEIGFLKIFGWSLQRTDGPNADIVRWNDCKLSFAICRRISYTFHSEIWVSSCDVCWSDSVSGCANPCQVRNWSVTSCLNEWEEKVTRGTLAALRTNSGSCTWLKECFSVSALPFASLLLLHCPLNGSTNDAV